MIKLWLVLVIAILAIAKVWADTQPQPPTAPAPVFANTLEKAKVSALWCGDNGNCKVDVFECLNEKQEPEFEKCFIPDYADN